MNREHKAKFEKAGWKIGTPRDLLGLTEAEEAVIEVKLALGAAVRRIREDQGLSQVALAKKMGSSQPRVAKLENRDPEVSLDLALRGLFAARPSARDELRGLVQHWMSSSRPVSISSKRAAASAPRRVGAAVEGRSRHRGSR